MRICSKQQSYRDKPGPDHRILQQPSPSEPPLARAFRLLINASEAAFFRGIRLHVCGSFTDFTFCERIRRFLICCRFPGRGSFNCCFFRRFPSDRLPRLIQPLSFFAGLLACLIQRSSFFSVCSILFYECLFGSGGLLSEAVNQRSGLLFESYAERSGSLPESFTESSDLLYERIDVFT